MLKISLTPSNSRRQNSDGSNLTLDILVQEDLRIAIVTHKNNALTREGVLHIMDISYDSVNMAPQTNKIRLF